VTLNYVPFGEKCLTMAVHLYEKTYKEAVVNQIQILTNFVHVSYIDFSLFLFFYLDNCVKFTPSVHPFTDVVEV